MLINNIGPPLLGPNQCCTKYRVYCVLRYFIIMFTMDTSHIRQVAQGDNSSPLQCMPLWAIFPAIFPVLGLLSVVTSWLYAVLLTTKLHGDNRIYIVWFVIVWYQHHVWEMLAGSFHTFTHLFIWFELPWTVSCLYYPAVFVHNYFLNHYAPVSQANWCNMRFTAGHLFPSYSCIGRPESSPHRDSNPGH